MGRSYYEQSIDNLLSELRMELVFLRSLKNPIHAMASPDVIREKVREEAQSLIRVDEIRTEMELRGHNPVSGYEP